MPAFSISISDNHSRTRLRAVEKVSPFRGPECPKRVRSIALHCVLRLWESTTGNNTLLSIQNLTQPQECSLHSDRHTVTGAGSNVDQCDKGRGRFGKIASNLVQRALVSSRES